MTVPKQSVATESVMLGGGCFWCLEAALGCLAGVVRIAPGYAGGQTSAPTYTQVCLGQTGHAEVVQVVFNPHALPFERLLQVFFAVHDPTTLNRQGHDLGTQYRSVVLCATSAQVEATQSWIARAHTLFTAPVVTEVRVETVFWPAEPEHHRYFARNPSQGYCRLVITPKLALVRERFGAWLGRDGSPSAID